MTFLVRDVNGSWREPVDTGYESEASLQAILAEHPSLLPGVSAEAVACRELYSNVGPVDVVTVDSDGAITVVECKLATNAQSRREIIGQVMDYASRLWQLNADEFDRLWTRANGTSVFSLLSDEENRIRTSVEENLKVGRFNLVLAVDRINEDLKRITEYLNEITQPSVGVMLCEFTHAMEGNTEILAPRYFGADLVAIKTVKSGTVRHEWTPEEFLSWCEENDPQGATKVAELIAALSGAGFYVGRGRAMTPSLNCGLMLSSGQRWPIAMYTSVERGALLEVRFSDFKKQPELAERMVKLISEIPNQNIPLDVVVDSGFTRRPNVSIRDFDSEALATIPGAVASALIAS